MLSNVSMRADEAQKLADSVLSNDEIYGKANVKEFIPPMPDWAKLGIPVPKRITAKV